MQAGQFCFYAVPAYRLGRFLIKLKLSWEVSRTLDATLWPFWDGEKSANTFIISYVLQRTAFVDWASDSFASPCCV